MTTELAPISITGVITPDEQAVLDCLKKLTSEEDKSDKGNIYRWHASWWIARQLNMTAAKALRLCHSLCFKGCIEFRKTSNICVWSLIEYPDHGKNSHYFIPEILQP